MAINYVAPSQAGQFTSHAYAGGGGGGVSPAMAIAQQNNEMDYLRLLQQKAAMGVTGRDVFQADTQMAAINQHAEAAAWLSQQQMTQRDVMDLKRKQNLVSMISNDSSLTPKEKSDGILDLMTGINFAQRRLHEEQIKAQAQARQERAEMHKEQGLAIAKRTELFGKTFNDRTAFWMDPTAHSKMAADIRTLQPGLEQANPAAFEKAIRQRAEDQGLGSHWYQEDVGKWKPVEKTAAQGKPTGTAGTTAGTPKPLTEKAARSEAEAKVLNENPEMDPKSPEYHKKVSEAVTAMKAEHEAKTPEGKVKIAEAKKQEQLGDNEANVLRLRASGLPPEQIRQGEVLGGMIRSFVKEHGVPAEGTDMRAKLDDLMRKFLDNTKPRPTVNQTPVAPQDVQQGIQDLRSAFPNDQRR